MTEQCAVRLNCSKYQLQLVTNRSHPAEHSSGCTVGGCTAVRLLISVHCIYIVIRSNNSAGISRTKVLLSHGENLLKDIIIFWSIAVNQAIIQNTNMHVIILPCCWVFDVLTMFLIIFERKSYPKT